MSSNRIKNYEQVFFRDMLKALIFQFNNVLTWRNRYDDENITVKVPVYYKLSGDRQFSMDAFVDDTINRRADFNYDAVPRGVLTWGGFTINSDRQANNTVIADFTRIKDDGPNLNQPQASKYKSSVTLVPITSTYKLEIILASEIDLMKGIEKMMLYFFRYRFFRFYYQDLVIKCFFHLPDGSSIETEIEMAGNDKKDVKLSYDFEVMTNYPVFADDSVLSPWATIEKFATDITTADLESMNDPNYIRNHYDIKEQNNDRRISPETD